MLIGIFLTLGAPGAAVAAADPVPAKAASASLVSTGNASPASARFPDHQAEAEYYDSLRQAPLGVSRGQARAAALKQAQTLPEVSTLPAAVGGKDTPARNALAPPSAIWSQLGPSQENTLTLNPTHDYRQGIVSGRATAIVVGPHTGIIYVGTAGGGVWKSTNDGASWTPLTDGQQSLAIGALVLDPADTTDRTLYAGTGEAHGCGDCYAGVGILKTVDGGTSWTLVGTGFPGFATYGTTSVAIGALAISGTTILAGTTAGLYISTNGGASWTQITVAAGQPSARVTDIAVDGANVYVVLSASTSGFAYSGVYKSLTSGSAGSFAPIIAGLPTVTTWGRAQLAIARSAPQTLYLAIAYGTNDSTTANRGNLIGIYKTTNGGTLWAATSSVGNPDNYFGEPGLPGQGWYDNTIAVDPANPNLVYAGGVDFVSSADGGATWVTAVDVYCGGTVPCLSPIHPDDQAIAFGPAGTPRPLYLANDGGVWKTANGNLGASATWSSLNTNLATLEYYSGDAAANYTSTSTVIGGAQDNGTTRSTSPTFGPWNSILGGDGMYVALDKTAPNTAYAEYANGNIFRTADASAGSAIAWTYIAPIDNNKVCNGTLFVAPFAVDPNAASHSHVVLGAGGYVCETINGGSNWVFSNFNTFFGQFVQSVAIAPANSAVIYAGTNGGRIFRTTAGNTGAVATWSDIWTGKGLPVAPVTSIAVDRNDSTGNIAYATFGSFGVGHIWKTIDGGTSWTNITGNLPDVPVTSITNYPSSPNPVLVVGTDIGAFLSTNNGTSWSRLMNGLPNVADDMVFTDTALTTLFVATHGRGMWKMPIPASDAFAAPTVTKIVSPVGPDTGGAPVTITGTGFRGGAAVYFDGIAATNVVTVNATTITATTPAHPDGTANVVVVNSDNQGGTLVAGYTFGLLNTLPGPKPGSGSGSPNPNPSPRPSGSSQSGPLGVLPNPKPRG